MLQQSNRITVISDLVKALAHMDSRVAQQAQPPAREMAGQLSQIYRDAALALAQLGYRSDQYLQEPFNRFNSRLGLPGSMLCIPPQVELCSLDTLKVTDGVWSVKMVICDKNVEGLTVNMDAQGNIVVSALTFCPKVKLSMVSSGPLKVALRGASVDYENDSNVRHEELYCIGEGQPTNVTVPTIRPYKTPVKELEVPSLTFRFPDLQEDKIFHRVGSDLQKLIKKLNAIFPHTTGADTCDYPNTWDTLGTPPEPISLVFRLSLNPLVVGGLEAVMMGHH